MLKCGVGLIVWLLHSPELCLLIDFDFLAAKSELCGLRTEPGTEHKAERTDVELELAIVV